MRQYRGREVQAPRDRRGAPGRQISSVAREPCFAVQKNPTDRVLTQPVGFSIMYVIVNLQMLFRVLHIPADLLGVAVLFAEHAAAILLHI